MGYDLFIIVTLPLLWLALNIFSFIIILLYNLGHALPALIFTKQPVIVYIGTFGDNNGKRLKAGRLTFCIKPKFAYLKQNGFCSYDNDMAFNKQLITLLGGPVVVLALFCVLFAEVCFSSVDVYSRIVLGVALVVSLFNLIINLFPRKLFIKDRIRLFYSDGYQLILMMEDKSNYINMMTACRFYDQGDYKNALLHLEKIDDKYMEESLFSLMLSCYIQLEQYNMVQKLQLRYENAKWQESVTANDYYLFGYADEKLNHYKQALAHFDHAIRLNAGHFNSRKGKAFVYNILNDYVMAKDEATRAIFIKENSSEAFSTRAYANFKLGKTGEAFTDADKALTLDENNPYAHLVMGMYLLDKGNTAKALKSFEHAKQLNKTMLYVDEQMAHAEQTPETKPIKAKSVRKTQS